MKKFFFFFVALLLAVPSLAQDVPLLQGKPFSHVTDTSVGVNWVSRIPIGDRDAVRFVIENLTAKRLLRVIWTATTTMSRPNLTDSGLISGTLYTYRIRAFFSIAGKPDSTSWVDLGTVQTAGQTSAVEQTAAVPVAYILGQNYPNPFNPETTIKYQLSVAGHVRLSIYTLLGQEVRLLIDRSQVAAYHTVVWDGRDDTGNVVPSGMYFYRLESGSFTAMKKMILMK